MPLAMSLGRGLKGPFAINTCPTPLEAELMEAYISANLLFWSIQAGIRLTASSK